MGKQGDEDEEEKMSATHEFAVAAIMLENMLFEQGDHHIAHQIDQEVQSPSAGGTGDTQVDKTGSFSC